MTDAEILKWAQSCPPEVMRMLSQTALRAMSHGVATTIRNSAAKMEMLERQSGKRASPTEIAEAMCAAILSANEAAWGAAGRA